jgi:hypothetical protein
MDNADQVVQLYQTAYIFIGYADQVVQLYQTAYRFIG